MGVFSKYHRYREAGEGANVNNVERFGEPLRSLFTSTKVFTMHHHIDITDESGRVCYYSRSKAISLHDRTYIYDADGEVAAYIERKFLTLHERHFVTMTNGRRFELSNELFHIYKDITNIEGLGWQLQGNMWGWNFELYDEYGGIIAVIGQKAFSLHDKFCIDIYREEYEREAVAILITLQHMLKDRASSSSGSSGSASSN